MELGNRGVLITGASRGIGAALAEAFAGRGARVMLVARTEGALKEMADRLGGTAHVADLAERSELDTLIEQVEDAAGPVDVLVCNAGVAFPRHILDQTPEEIARTTEVNYLAGALLARQAVPRMLSRGRGHVVFLAGIAEALGIPGLTSFGAAGAAVTAFARGLRLELAGTPIGVTTCVLGPVRTALFEELVGYAPYRSAVELFSRLQAVTETDPAAVARTIVDAVRRGRRRVVVPSRLAPLVALREAPGRLAELLQKGRGSMVPPEAP